MRISDAIQQRRTVKRFTTRAVTREELETILAAATIGPNHRLSQPWRFYVLGPEARHAYGTALGNRKAKKLEDAAAAQSLRDKVAEEHRSLPALIAVAMVTNENLEIREEDYAAVMMGVENLLLTAVELGLGSAIKTGAIMDDPAARAAVSARNGERIVAMVSVGEPIDQTPPKTREAAAAFTTWLA